MSSTIGDGLIFYMDMPSRFGYRADGSLFIGDIDYRDYDNELAYLADLLEQWRNRQDKTMKERHDIRQDIIQVCENIEGMIENRK